MSPAEAIERHAAAIQKVGVPPPEPQKIAEHRELHSTPGNFLAGPEGIEPPTRSLPATPMSL